MTLLAFGCSVTHGADLVHPNQHEDNANQAHEPIVGEEQVLQEFHVASFLNMHSCCDTC